MGNALALSKQLWSVWVTRRVIHQIHNCGISIAKIFSPWVTSHLESPPATLSRLTGSMPLPSFVLPVGGGWGANSRMRGQSPDGGFFGLPHPRFLTWLALRYFKLRFSYFSQHQCRVIKFVFLDQGKHDAHQFVGNGY